MHRRFAAGVPALLLVVAGLATGCGGGGTGGSTPSSTTSAPPKAGATSTPTPGQQGTSSGADALTAEAQATAAGDIPDNQVFLTFTNAAESYTIKYPEGWAQRGSGARVVFQDKNNLVRIVVAKGADTTVASVLADMNRLKQSAPSLRFEPPSQLTWNGRGAVKVVYSTVSAPNPVTGKRVTLVVDRYYLPGTGKHAVADLGTPQGVDNVDAYRLMIESFRWK